MSPTAPRVYVYRKSGRTVWDVEIWFPDGKRKTWRSGLEDREAALHAGLERAQALLALPDASAPDNAPADVEAPVCRHRTGGVPLPSQSPGTRYPPLLAHSAAGDTCASRSTSCPPERFIATPDRYHGSAEADRPGLRGGRDQRYVCGSSALRATGNAIAVISESAGPFRPMVLGSTRRWLWSTAVANIFKGPHRQLGLDKQWRDQGHAEHKGTFQRPWTSS